MIEYFKPHPAEPGAIPLGVIVQDDQTIVYRLIEPPRFHVGKFSEFALEQREDTMHRNILVPRYRKIGSNDFIPITEQDFLVRLAEDGMGYFRYGAVWSIGLDFEVERFAN